MVLTLDEDEQQALRDALGDWTHSAAAWMSQGDQDVRVTFGNLQRVMQQLRVAPKVW